MGKPGWIAFVLPLIIYILTLDGKASTSGVDAAITGTQYALWKYGTLSLGTPPHLISSTIDYGVYHGLAYSAIAPGMTLISYPFAAFSFASGISVRLADEFFLSLAGSVGIYFVYRICRLYAGPAASLMVALAAAFGTPIWPFTTVVFENVLSMMFAVVSVYFVLRYSSKTPRTAPPLVAGVLLGLASFVEYAAVLFVVPLALYVWYRSRSARSTGILILSFLVGPILNAIYDFVLFGNPLILPEELKSKASQPLVGILASFNIGSAPIHVLLYIASPYRGVIFLCPVMFLGILAIIPNWRVASLRAESLLLLSLALLIIVFYSAWWDWAGGLAYGPRFLTIAAPFMTVPLAPYLDRIRRHWEGMPFYALVVYGSFIQGAGAMTTAYSNAGGSNLFQPLSLNIPWLLDSHLGLWWLASSTPDSVLVGYIVVGAIYLTIWATISLAMRAKLRAQSAAGAPLTR